MIPRLNTEHEVALGHLDFFSKAKVCSVSSTQFHCLFVPLVSCSVSGPCSVFVSVEKRLFFISFTPVCPPQQNLYPCSRYSAKAAEQHEKTVEHFFLYDGAKGL